jgi:hypothetical protein
VHRQFLPLADGRGLCPGRWAVIASELYSAGIEAHGKNPRAIAAMDRGRHRYLGQESTRLTMTCWRRPIWW